MVERLFFDADGPCMPELTHRKRSFRLEPTAEQEAVFQHWCGCARLLWNVALQQRAVAWQLNKGRTDDRHWTVQPQPTFASQRRELTELRQLYPWLCEVPAAALQQKLRDLDAAFSRFFAGRASHPRPKKKGRSTDSVRFADPGDVRLERLNKQHGRVRLPKVGWVRFRWSRAVVGHGEQLRNLTLIRRVDTWEISVGVASPTQQIAPSGLPVVGVDRGVVRPAATSDGVEPTTRDGQPIVLHQATPHEQRRVRRLQRKLARQPLASRNRQRTRRQLAKLAQRDARRRADWANKLALSLARSHGLVVLENLRVTNMTRSARGTLEQPGRQVRQKATLNRAILQSGWGMLCQRLAQVCPEQGSRLRLMSPVNSSRTCHVCQTVDPASRESQAVFACTACGWTGNADTNAARVILQRGTAAGRRTDTSRRGALRGCRWRLAHPVHVLCTRAGAGPRSRNRPWTQAHLRPGGSVVFGRRRMSTDAGS